MLNVVPFGLNYCICELVSGFFKDILMHYKTSPIHRSLSFAFFCPQLMDFICVPRGKRSDGQGTALPWCMLVQ